MKFLYLCSIIQVVFCTAFAKDVQKINKRKVETSNECKYINSFIKKDDSFNCCELDGITCENDHITEL